MRLSIRWRLALWNTLALAAVLACFASLVYLLFRQALHEQIDRQLRIGLRQLQADPRLETALDARIEHWVEEYRDHLHLYCVIYRPDGTIHARTPELLPARTLARSTR